MTRTTRRPAALLAAALLAGAGPAAAQETIAFGQSARGELSAEDALLANGVPYDVWRLEGREGQRIAVTLRSADFDAALGVGRDAVGICFDCEYADDGAGGSDARIRMTLRRTGTFEIRAAASAPGEGGAYALTLEEIPVPPPLDPGPEIAAGQTVEGTLDPSDRTTEDGQHFDLWSYRGPDDERIVITLRAEEFEPFLAWGRIVLGVWQEFGYGEGDDAAERSLEVKLGDDGIYQIRVRSLTAGETGRYTLTVSRP